MVAATGLVLVMHLYKHHYLRVPTSVALLAVIAAVPFSMADDTPQIPFRVDNLVVVPIDSVEIPASRSGIVAVIGVKEGDEVVQDDVIGSLDDRHALLAERLATNELRIAEKVSDSQSQTEAAQSKLGSEKQTAEQLILVHKIAKLKAGNDLRVLAAQKSAAAAKNEYERALKSRRQYAESVSNSEIDSLRLAFEKSKLESQQAEFERTIASLEVGVEIEKSKRQQMLIQLAQTDLDAAATDSGISELQLQNKQAQLELAKATLADHRLSSPINGQITKVHKEPGSWAIEGEPIVRIVRLDRLRLEGFAQLKHMGTFRSQSKIDLRIESGLQVISRIGEISFIDPEIDPVTGEFRFWIDFDNADRKVLPGMRASVRIVP